MDKKDEGTKRCGYIAIIGRPNVGKSTLLNKILGQKLSITCRKPQTTRHQLIGIHTTDDVQAIFVDTPGMHKTSKKAINRYMNRAAKSVIHDVDVVLFLVEGKRWTEEEDWILQQLKTVEAPVVLVINKVDMIKDKGQLLPLLQDYSKRYDWADIIPISAKQGSQVEGLEKSLSKYLPINDFFYEEDQITDRSTRFLTAEIIREKLMRFLGDELPYDITVEIEHFKEQPKLTDIAAVIYVERATQKAIIIGYKGEKLKEIGQQARLDIEKLLERKIFLQLWVKVKSGWADDDKQLQSLGYD